MMSEKAYENKIKKFLKEKGIWYIKYNPEFYGRAGVPDILACCNGRFLAIEVKRENGKVSPLQQHNINELKRNGAIALITRPSEFEKLKETICNIHIQK